MKKAKRTAKEREEFFVCVPDPKGVRKNLLEVSQQLLEGMKSYEKYKKIKAKKLQKMEALKATMKGIEDLTGKVRACLPTVKGLPEKAKVEKMPHIAAIELEQLHKEIAKLEEELGLVR